MMVDGALRTFRDRSREFEHHESCAKQTSNFELNAPLVFKILPHSEAYYAFMVIGLLAKFNN